MRARLITAILALAATALVGAQEEAPSRPQDAGETPAMVTTEDGRKAVSDLPEKQQVNVWMARAAAAYNAEDTRKWVRALEALHELRPYNQDFMRQLVQGYARLDQKTRSYNIMLKMQQQGLAYDWDSDPEVENLRGTQLYKYLSRLMREAGEHFGEGEVVTRLDASIVMPEALAHDPETGRFFVGTVRDGRILAWDDELDEHGSWQTFAEAGEVEGLDAAMAMAIDDKRRHLWVATSVVSQFKDYSASSFGRTALVKFDLDSGERLGHYPLAEDDTPHVLGSLTVAGDGTVFAADTLGPGVYRLKPGADNPERFMGHPDFSSLRGIALSGDDRLLYVADYERGIYVADVVDEQAYELAVPDTLNVGGIDGMYWWDGNLVIIQNGIAPQRVMRLELGEDGLGVVSASPVEAAHPAFDTPTFGTLVDNQLYYLGANHWDDVDARGRTQGELPPTPVVRTRVDAEWARDVSGDVAERLRELSGEKRPPEL